jgi:serine/threonine protein kinase
MPSNAPKLQRQLEMQKKPKKRWRVLEKYGTNGGGLNGGINKVEEENDPYDRFFIEKVFTEEHVLYGWAKKEITLLHHVCDHENIVEYVDHYLDTTKLISSLYMEYCESGSLEDVIKAVQKGKPVHERRIWKWCIGLMSALVYCHYGPTPDNERYSRLYWDSMYHRDIKPGNILLKKNSQKGEIIAKLGDFGCATSDHFRIVSKRQEEASRTSAVSWGFDAPEYPEFSRLTDVWQLALCIACVCTGMINPRSRKNPEGEQWDRRQPAGARYSRALNEALGFGGKRLSSSVH